MMTNLLREGGFRAKGKENFICVKSGHNLSVSHGSHGGMGNKGRRRVRNLGYSTVYVSTVILYMECQLYICKAYWLTLSLKKSHFFPKRFEFVGIDVSADGNQPAMSKHKLLRHWPLPESNWFKMWPALLGSFSFTAISSIILSCAPCLSTRL